MADAASGQPRHHAGIAALTLGALGVVFGDIGTSPLYALQAVFAADHGAVKPTQGDVYGIISLVVWSVTLIVSVKFVTFIMRADNEGEGGPPEHGRPRDGVGAQFSIPAALWI